jgi:hypothetical protein
VFILLVAGQSSNTPPAPESVRPAQQAQQQQQVRQARQLIKCEDRERFENSIPGVEMMKRAIPAARLKIASGDVTPEEREQLLNAIARAEASMSKYRAENPCL